MACHGTVHGSVRPAAHARDGDEHLRLLERHQHLLHVAQQRAQPRTVEGGTFAGEAVEEGEDTRRRLRDLVDDLAGLVAAGQEVLSGPFVAEDLAVGRSAEPRLLAAELLEEGVDVGVELLQRQLRTGAGKGLR